MEMIYFAQERNEPHEKQVTLNEAVRIARVHGIYDHVAIARLTSTDCGEIKIGGLRIWSEEA